MSLLCLIQLKFCSCIKIEKRSPEVFCSTKFTGKHLYQSLFFSQNTSRRLLLKIKLLFIHNFEDCSTLSFKLFNMKYQKQSLGGVL